MERADPRPFQGERRVHPRHATPHRCRPGHERRRRATAAHASCLRVPAPSSTDGSNTGFMSPCARIAATPQPGPQRPSTCAPTAGFTTAEAHVDGLRAPAVAMATSGAHGRPACAPDVSRRRAVRGTSAVRTSDLSVVHRPGVTGCGEAARAPATTAGRGPGYPLPGDRSFEWHRRYGGLRRPGPVDDPEGAGRGPGLGAGRGRRRSGRWRRRRRRGRSGRSPACRAGCPVCSAAAPGR
jgi:hypothetical protein